MLPWYGSHTLGEIILNQITECEHAQYEKILINFSEQFCRYGVTLSLENFTVSGLLEQSDGLAHYAVQFKPHAGDTFYLLKLINSPAGDEASFGLNIISANRIVTPDEKNPALMDFAERTYGLCLAMMTELMKNQQPGWFEPRLLN